MNTLTVTLVRPLFAMTRADWALWLEGKPTSLAHLDPESLLTKGEVERFVWWASEQLPATLQACDAAALLDDYAREFMLQRAPDCVAERSTVTDDVDLRLGCIELELRLTHRVARRLFEALGLPAPAVASAARVRPTPSSDVAPERTSTAPTMTRFEERLRLWLAGFGITGDEANVVCSQRRVASCIKDADSGDLVRELPSALTRIWQVSEEARRRISEPGEMLLLMNFLSER